MGLTAGVHPDFGTYAGYGIPVNAVSRLTNAVRRRLPVARRVRQRPLPHPGLAEDRGQRRARRPPPADGRRTGCHLWELYAVSQDTGGWHAGSGAIWDLRSNALRPDGWTSADAAGLPIAPGLANYDEVAAGLIAHALRFTVPKTRQTHIYPARHDAGSGTSASLPPMGLRIRLKASVSITGFGPQSQVILTALKRYGMILADNGSPFYISGTRRSALGR